MNRSAPKKILQTYGTVLALAVIVLAFSLIRPDKFCTLTNFINITRQISLLVMISLGTTLVMSVNEFDLSVGSMASLGGVMAALLAVKGLPMVLVNAVSGCEEYNLRHFCGLGGAVTAEGNRALAELCADLLASPERLEKMSGALGVKGSAAEELCRVMTQEAEA